MKIYTISSPYRFTFEFKLHCEYCSREFLITHNNEQTIKVSMPVSPPSRELLSWNADNEFQRLKKNIEKESKKNKYPYLMPPHVSVKCPDCGFIPSYLINKSQGLKYIYLLLFIGLAVMFPTIIISIEEKTPVGFIVSLVCLIPLALGLLILIHSITPNRKLIQKARDERREIPPPIMPELIHSSAVVPLE